MVINSRKKKECVLLLLCIGCLLVLVKGHILGKAGMVQMSVPVMSADRIENLTQGMKKGEASSYPLYFNGHEIAYDCVDDIYYNTQNMGNHFWSGQIGSDVGRLYWQGDDFFALFDEALEQGHVFSLYCVDEDNETWCDYRVVFTGMPTMMIDTVNGADIGDEILAAQMQLCDLKFPGKEYLHSACQVAIRGDSSRRFDKQGYKLVLNEKLSLLGMRTDEDWILAALYDDDGLIHTKFSYDIWRDIAKDNSVKKDDGTTMEFVELFCNDTYLGVYGLIERIDAKELSLKGSENDILYKCSGYELPDESLGWAYGLENAYGIKYPKEYDSGEWLPLKEYLEVFASEEGITDYEKARSMLNMENAIDHNIFTILSYGHDNYLRKNTFYLAEWGGKKNPGYTMIKIPWDCNVTWGIVWRYGLEFNNTIYEPERITDPNLWSSDMKALFRCYPDEIASLTQKRWEYLREDILDKERLLRMLDEEFAYLHGSGAYDRNYRLWPNGTEYWDDSYIYEYVEGRLEYLDVYFQDPYLDEVPALDY